MTTKINYTIPLNVYKRAILWEDVEPSGREHLWESQKAKHGFDERQTWSLDFTVLAFLIPRMIMFVEWGDQLQAEIQSLVTDGEIYFADLYEFTDMQNSEETKVKEVLRGLSQIQIQEAKNRFCNRIGKVLQGMWW